MGYFSRLQKRARNEAGWSGYTYTGSSAAGADIVSEDTWCVVYGANVVYEGSGEKLSSLTVATNFVNPLSSGNPSQVSCYLYTSDPTSGGSFDVSSPPAGAIAVVSDSFEAHTAGLYRSFTFSGLDMRPSQVFFWFTSSVSQESHGSNRIYHYATGNYIAALDSGTRTPALLGSFTGSPGSGTEGGGGSGSGTYTVVASGSYSNIFAQREFTYSRKWHSASYTALSFTGAGEARFICEHNDGGDSALELRGYLTIGNGFDTARGVPTGTIVGSATGQNWYRIFADVVSGQTYYLWTVIDSCSTDTVPLLVTVVPDEWSYTLSNKGSSLNLAQSKRTFTMSMSAFQTGRMTLSFGYSAWVDIAVSAGSGAFSAVVFLSDQQDIDSATGLPLSYSESWSADYGGSMFVETGKTYYFFAIYNGGSEAGSVSFTITPPEIIWTQGGSNSYSLLSAAASPSVSLGAKKYHCIKASFAHSGMLWLYATGINAGEGSAQIYLCSKDCFDTYYGYPTEYVSSLTAYEAMETPLPVVAGTNYYIYVRNSDENGTLKMSLKLTPPPAPDHYSLELEGYFPVQQSFTQEQQIRYYGYIFSTLEFRDAGAMTVSMEKSAFHDDRTVHLRAYLCSEEGIDELTGKPTGEVLASYTGGGESFSLSATVENDREYYLYTVCDEIYGDFTADLIFSVTAPPARYFSITERTEQYALEGIYNYSAAPGESGVLLMELSFAQSGRATISASLTGGSDYLMAWAALSPYLDGFSGAPAEEIIKSASGSSTAAGLELSFPVQKYTSYYVFIRGRSVYDAAEFEVDVKAAAAVMGIYHQGTFLKGRPYVYTNGTWQPAEPLCRKNGQWHRGS